VHLLQEGGGRRITVEPGGKVVHKSFSGLPPEEARRQARSEYERLQSLAAAIRVVPGAASPQPLELVSAPVPGIRMELLGGEPLVDVLAKSVTDPGWRRGLATTMVRALRAYVDAVGEPYPDFQFNNMLWDRSSRVLGFVDVGEPDRGRPLPGGTSPFEAGIANLVASTVFQSARPRWLGRRRQHRQAVALCAEAVAIALSEPNGPDPGRLRAAARAVYVREAYGGGLLASTWYGSVGYVAGRRVTAPGLRFGPVPPHRLRRAPAG
jgi:hypothetical protein